MPPNRNRRLPGGKVRRPTKGGGSSMSGASGTADGARGAGGAASAGGALGESRGGQAGRNAGGALDARRRVQRPAGDLDERFDGDIEELEEEGLEAAPVVSLDEYRVARP